MNWLESAQRHGGQFYWCVKVPTRISKSGEIYLMADRVAITPDGSVMFLKEANEKQPEKPTLILPPHTWQVVYAASLIDNYAVSVVNWPGEVIEPNPSKTG